jgi:hypothetical protein
VDVSKPTAVQSITVHHNSGEEWPFETQLHLVLDSRLLPPTFMFCKLSESLKRQHINERIICSDDYKTPDFAHTVSEYTGLRVHLRVVYLTTGIIQSNKWLKMTNNM